MKILILVKSMDGGTGTFVLNLLKVKKFFKKDRVDIRVVCLEKPSFRKITTEPVKYLRARSYYPQHYGFSFNMAWRLYQEIRFFRKLVADLKVDLIISVDIHANLMALACKLMMFDRIRVIINNRNNLSEVLRSKSSGMVLLLLKVFVRIFYNKADAVCAVSEGVKKDLQKRFHVMCPVRVIYNGITVKPGIRPRMRNVSDTFLSIGRFSKQKDYSTLIRAFSLVCRRIPGCRMVMVGDGPCKAAIRSLIQRLNLSKDIRLEPWNNGVSAVYAKADIFILSSNWEGMPNVLLEAMSAGMPVISTNTPYGPSEVLQQNRYGLLVPVRDEGRLADAMTLLLKDKKKYMHFARMALERVGHFTLEGMLSSYYRIICETANISLK